MAQLVQEKAQSSGGGRTSRGPKIAVIGAGSSGFGKRFVHDVITRPALADGTLTLMDINAENLDIMSNIARKMVAEIDAPTKLESTTDRREALDGADYVISTVQLYGIDVWHQPMRIARTYGVDQVVGCTTGPGGTFATLRYAPFMLGLCHDMEELCPDALLLHYANPTAVVSWVLYNAVPNIKSIGLCHSVLGTARELAGYIGAPFEETGHWVAGLNHQAWYLRYEWNKRDAYPLIWEKLDDPEIYGADPVRFEILKYFDYFTTESSVHHTDYYPYFRRTPEMMARYAPTRGAMAGMGKDYTNDENWKKLLVTRRETLRREAYGPDPVPVKAISDEYCVGIINAIETNVPFRFNGNVMNTGLITNLPNCCVEVPCLVDNMGIHPCYVGDLPEQCASLNRSRSAGDALMVKGALEGDRKAVEQAIALDPLTASVLTLDQIRKMVEEIFKVQEPYIAGFE